MKCTKCGSEIPDGSKFCNNCGTKVKAETTEMGNLIMQDYSKLRHFIITHKKVVFVYAIWGLINIICFLFGEDSMYNKIFFFPFSGKIRYYDITEFVVYVVALPVAIIIVYHIVTKVIKKKDEVTVKNAHEDEVKAFRKRLDKERNGSSLI